MIVDHARSLREGIALSCRNVDPFGSPASGPACDVQKMIANGKAPAVDYGIRPRDDGRFEIVWKTAPTIGEVEASTNPRLSVNEDPSYAPPNPRRARATGPRATLRSRYALDPAVIAGKLPDLLSAHCKFQPL
jgi:hypothetical protein